MPFSIAQKKGDPIVFATDEFINKKTSAEALAGLRPAFDKAGSVTAGNASGLNDGAAGVVVMTAKKAAALGLDAARPYRKLRAAGARPVDHGHGAGTGLAEGAARAGWKPQDLDLLEINEAFAAQACAVNSEMGWDTSKVNVNGGAIAIGHPIGASGCRILVTLLHEMQRRDAKKGIATLCIGGGMGVALAIERPEAFRFITKDIEMRTKTDTKRNASFSSPAAWAAWARPSASRWPRPATRWSPPIRRATRSTPNGWRR